MSLLDPSMEDLPEQMMLDIFSRLPVKTIIHCKCVCKNWLNIVLESYFADLQLSRSPAGFMIHQIERQMISYSKPGILKWVVIKEDLDHNRLYQDPIISVELNLSPIFQNSRVHHVGSANGLICLRQYDIKKNNYFICNPITREYIILPTQQYYKEGYVVINHEFKLLPSPPVETPQGSGFHVRTLGVLKGCLCQCDSFGSQFTIWIMKEYGIKKSWHKELVIKRNINTDLGLLILFRIEGLKDGTILIQSDTELLAYCPRRKTIVDTDLSDCCLT